MMTSMACLRSTAGGLALFDDSAARLSQARIDLVQFVGVLDLDAEMIQPGLPSARGDREIDAGIIEHPFGIIRLDHSRFRREQRGVEADGMRDVRDRDVNVQAAADVQDTPPQQFSVRKPSTEFMVSN